jgi:hypothetical protein
MILQCSGLQIGPIVLPSFDVSKGKAVGLALEAEYGLLWCEAMQILGGSRAHQAVSLAGRSTVICPQGLEPNVASKQTGSVYEHLLNEGISPDEARDILARMRLSADDNLGELQLTVWLLLQLEMSWTMGACLVVFSSSGLDPGGLATVFGEVFRHRASCSALDVFSIYSGQPTHWYDRVVHCPVA